MGGDKRTRDQRPAQLLEDEGRFGQSEPDTAGLFGQAEIEHAGLAQLTPSRAVHHPVGAFMGADPLQRRIGPGTAGGRRRPDRSPIRSARSPRRSYFPGSRSRTGTGLSSRTG